MYDDKYYRALAENKWDTYRDLNKIYKDEFSDQHGLNKSNTLLIDSEVRKVQYDLENSLVFPAYTQQDVSEETNELNCPQK